MRRDGMDVVIAPAARRTSHRRAGDHFEAVMAGPRPERGDRTRPPPTCCQTAEFVARGTASRASPRTSTLRSPGSARRQPSRPAASTRRSCRSVTMAVADKATGAISHRRSVRIATRANRRTRRSRGLRSLRDRRRRGHGPVTPASCPGGASARDADGRAPAERRGLKALGIYRGMAVAGTAPEMGIGPGVRDPKLLKAHGLKVEDVACGSSTKPSPARPCTATDQLEASARSLQRRRRRHVDQYLWR